MKERLWKYYLHFSLDPLLKQNHEVYTRESHLKTNPVLSLFTLRETIPISYHRSFPFRRFCKFPGNIVNRSSVLFSHRNFAFYPIWINYPVSPPRTRVGTSPIPRKCSRSLIPLSGSRHSFHSKSLQIFQRKRLQIFSTLNIHVFPISVIRNN